MTKNNCFYLQPSLVPSATSASKLPGNRKDENTAPKGSGRKTAPRSGSGAGCESAAKSRSADVYDVYEEYELKDDPLYAPPGNKKIQCMYHPLGNKN